MAHPDSAQRAWARGDGLRPPLPVDDRRVLSQFGLGAPDPTARHAILVENPERLCGFELRQR